MGKKDPPPPPEPPETIKFDPRFPNQNQTRHCYQSYIDYHSCINLRGEGYQPCEYFKKAFTVLCPCEWVARWDEQRENCIFPGRIKPPPPEPEPETKKK